MITIKVLREAIAEIISRIPEINSVKEVSNDDRFVNQLEDHKISDNALLVVVIPYYKGFGEIDQGGFYSHFQFFILNKIDYKTTQPEEIQEKLQPVAQDFLKCFFQYAQNECKIFRNIDRDAVELLAVTNKGNCAGWEIQLTDKSHTGNDGRIG